MDPTERFAALVQSPTPDVALGEAALCIAALDHPVDIDASLGVLDALATDAPSAGLASYLFADCGFTGNRTDYGDPRNSFLDEVLDRRLGLPITLSVVMIEVGRRIGQRVEGIGMPGHFLVRDEAGAYFDPFHGGARLDESGCRQLYGATHGDARFASEYLEPIDSRAILARMLANLTNTFVDREPRHALWTLRLRDTIPGLSIAERRHDASVLGALGRFGEAADALTSLAHTAGIDDADSMRRQAAAYRSRAN